MLEPYLVRAPLPQTAAKELWSAAVEVVAGLHSIIKRMLDLISRVLTPWQVRGVRPVRVGQLVFSNKSRCSCQRSNNPPRRVGRTHSITLFDSPCLINN